MRTITEIVVHCAAVPPDWRAGQSVEAKRNEIRRWHVGERGWRNIGYHAVIDRDGSVAWGRPPEQAGAHVAGRNSNTLGVCLIGGAGSDANDKFSDNYTPAQDAALRKMIENWKRRFPSIKKVSGHNEYAAKACPGFRVAEWLAGKPRGIAQSRTMQGGVMAGTGTAATAALDVVQEVQGQVAGLMGYADTLRWVFLALALAGIGLTIYARMSDWKAGHR